MKKSCFNCANKEEIYDNGEEKVVVCEINRYIENIYPREAEATASRCIAYKEESLTNEEWFCGLSTEEKARWLYDHYVNARADEHYGRQEKTLSDYQKWLVDAHKGIDGTRVG